MNFFGILFDIKNGKKVPYSKTYFDTLFAAKLAEMQIKTLTGTLPLTFTTSETALRSWIIYGNDYQQTESYETRLPLSFYTDEDTLRDWTIYGNNNVSENKFDVAAYNADFKAGVIINENGEEVASQVGGYSTYLTDVKPSTEYMLVGRFSTGSTNVRIYYFANDVFLTRSEAFTMTSTTSSKTFTTPVNCNQITLQSAINADRENAMLVEGDTAPAEYIPYQVGVGQPTENGYIIPLSVNGNTVNIPIGNAPLTASDTATKASTGVDIATVDGTNTISTTLYNKPEMSVTYGYKGVGEYVNGQWQIPLTISSGGQSTDYTIPIDAPLTAGQSVTDALTINTFEGENVLDTTLENKPTMTITYK